MTWAPSGPSAFLSLGDVLLAGPCGLPWTHRLSALNPFLQPTFRSRAPVAKTPSPETLRRTPWEIPPSFCFEILSHEASPPSFGKTLDHLAVIQPPAAPCLTARRRLRVEEPSLHALARGGHARQRFRLLFASLLEPSDALFAIGGGARERSCLLSMIPFPRAARQCGPLPRDQGAFHRESSCRAPSRGSPGASRPLAGGRCGCTCSSRFKTSTRPSIPAFAVLFRPRALPRLLQINVSTSTALDRPSIPQRGPRERVEPGTTACFRSIVASRSGQPPKVRRVRGRGSPNPRRSLPGLLPRETSPRPRSLQAPCVAGIARHPARRRRGVTDRAAGAARASKARAAAGRCGA
jgi:hypothetical protein